MFDLVFILLSIVYCLYKYKLRGTKFLIGRRRPDFPTPIESHIPIYIPIYSYISVYLPVYIPIYVYFCLFLRIFGYIYLHLHSPLPTYVYPFCYIYPPSPYFRQKKGQVLQACPPLLRSSYSNSYFFSQSSRVLLNPYFSSRATL